jgi:membrane fusion protein (multidrug efflux system)
MALSRRTIAVSIIILLVATLGTGIYLRLSGGGDGAGDGGGSDTTGGDPAATSAGAAFSTDIAVPVEGASVIQDTLVISVNAAAQAAAEKRATLKAQVEGRVQRIRVGESAAVRDGQVLIQIDPTQYELEVDRARAQRATAQASFNELTLFDENLTDSTVRAERARVARAKSGLDGAEVGLKEAELTLQRATVRAPFSGRVANLKVVPGQWVAAGDELVTVVDIDPLKVEVQVLEGEVGLLAPGRGATVTFAAFPGERFQGRIATINPVVEEQTRTARVTVTIANPDARVLPGMYARVALEARKFPNRILVPRAAILERDRRTMLFVFEGEGSIGLSKWRYVTTGLANDSLVEIVENSETDTVRPGEIVLTDGHYTLIHDANVRLVEDVRAAGGRPR